jgi:hypothetical protein
MRYSLTPCVSGWKPSNDFWTLFGLKSLTLATNLTLSFFLTKKFMYSRKKTYTICCVMLYINNILLMTTCKRSSKWVKSSLHLIGRHWYLSANWRSFIRWSMGQLVLRHRVWQTLILCSVLCLYYACVSSSNQPTRWTSYVIMWLLED